MTTSSTGGDHLARKAEIVQLSKKLPRLERVLIVDDVTLDADKLRSTLRVVLGYDPNVTRAPTLGAAIDHVMAQRPDILFLDDLLKPSDTASHSIPYLRRAAYDGPIVVVSGELTRSRRTELVALGATEVIHKDDVESLRLTEAMLRAFKIS
jgi:DNA-binding NarL/FixJ family response regulator